MIGKQGSYSYHKKSILKRCFKDSTWVRQSQSALHFVLTSSYVLSKVLQVKKRNKKMKKVPYASTVKNLMYAMVCTRPYLVHSIDVVSRFLANLGKEHWDVVKWIFRYLKRSSDLCLWFSGDKPFFFLKVYTNTNIAKDIKSRKSTSRYLFTYAGEQYHDNLSYRSV